MWQLTGFVKPDSLVGGLTHPVGGDSGDDTDDMNISDDDQTVIEVCQSACTRLSLTSQQQLLPTHSKKLNACTHTLSAMQQRLQDTSFDRAPVFAPVFHPR